ncbi:unnamed protein product [Tilletia controversa]|uniref:REJ domain-containing protein n=1 Tax=Tilletia caries TaxID=13290 RepID=A0ABN7J0R3_9BASI|nr:unnamed protein product [Tilletia caries]CAD6981427.1 unnamed protein product [Tilletia controversa]
MAAAITVPHTPASPSSFAAATTVSATVASWTHKTKSRNADGAPRARGRSTGSTCAASPSSAGSPSATSSRLSGSTRASGSAAGPGSST